MVSNEKAPPPVIESSEAVSAFEEGHRFVLTFTENLKDLQKDVLVDCIYLGFLAARCCLNGSMYRCYLNSGWMALRACQKSRE